MRLNELIDKYVIKKTNKKVNAKRQALSCLHFTRHTAI